MATERSRSNFNSTIDGNITTNGTGLITGAIANSDFKDVAQSAAWLEDFNPITASGTDTYTCSMALTLTSYSNGRFFLIKFTNANTGAATLNVNSLGAVAIKKNGTTALAAGDIGAGTVRLLTYDGTNFQIVGNVSSGGGISGLTTNRVPYATSSTTIGDDAGMTYASGSDQLYVLGGIGVGLATIAAALHVQGANNTPALYVQDDAANGIFEAGETGGARVIGFFGVGPAARQTSGANLTNNVTTGGSNDVIADFSDLTIYANDAAAIRNDIYQLARKLKQVNDALRSYGLLT